MNGPHLLDLVESLLQILNELILLLHALLQIVELNSLVSLASHQLILEHSLLSHKLLNHVSLLLNHFDELLRVELGSIPVLPHHRRLLLLSVSNWRVVSRAKVGELRRECSVLDYDATLVSLQTNDLLARGQLNVSI